MAINSLGADAYAQALKEGEACFKQRKAEGQDPYLPVLDHLLDAHLITGRKPRGIREIPLEQIIGTKTQGRTEAFAHNFMPLLGADTEFAGKWISLYNSQMEEGIRDPITCLLVYGECFVMEGNKRVSVLKACKAGSVMANVTELTLNLKGTSQEELYEQYLKFCQSTGLFFLKMSQPKNYTQLLKIVEASPEHPLNPEASQDLKSQFAQFRSVFQTLGGERLRLSAGDAFLLYLRAFGFVPFSVLPGSLVRKEVESLWEDLAVYPDQKKTALLSDTAQKPRILPVDLFSFRSNVLKAALLCSGDPARSPWALSHKEALESVNRDMGSNVIFTGYFNVNTQAEIKAAFERAIREDNSVIFAASPTMLQLANQFAAEYPRIKILNCSLNVENAHIRLYYPRDYEIQFLMGLLAGILTRSAHIGYIADYPIFGTLANINAFAIGVQMTCPRAQVWLDWSTTIHATEKDFPTDIDMMYVAGDLFDPRIGLGKKFGLFDVRAGQFLHLATVQTDWSVFYEKILQSILHRSWNQDIEASGTNTVHYWWGLSSGLLDARFSPSLPAQTLRMLDLIRQALVDQTFYIFAGRILSQDGMVHDSIHGLDLQDVATMDWLCDNIRGVIPKEKQISSDARDVVSLHAVDKVLEDDA